jgi:ribosome biogenesis GTPase / thiamine phosphate phosphatase
LEKALIVKSTGSWYKVRRKDGSTVNCKLKGNLRTKFIKSTNPVCVGDWVEFYINSSDGVGQITNIDDRKNYLVRRSINLSKNYQVIAANIDFAFLIVTIDFPKTTTIFIDRFLATAEAYMVSVNIVFNKIDLYNEKMMSKLTELKNIYEKIGYNCFQISAKENINIDSLKEKMQNKVNVFVGNSGVGKSTILNSIDESLNLKTGDISDYHKKGKHTTTFSEMFELSEGGFIVDTPGIKGFGVFDMQKEELFHFFPEIFELSKNCRYNNCTHIHEPQCAVKVGLKEKEISNSRYDSYLSLMNDNYDKYRINPL